MAELLQTFIDLATVAGRLLVQVLQLGLSWSLLLVWVAWWLWAVNWKKTWKVLGEGAWVPLVLMALMGAAVWSQVNPRQFPISSTLAVANFWWQLGAVGLLVGSAFFCGWLQGHFGWTPAEIDLEPPLPAAHGHGHH